MDRIKPESFSQQNTSTSASTIIGKDGAEMVLIPAGSFQMGSNDGEGDEKPVHTVYVDAFYMDKYEVTNAQYQKFMQATGHRKSYYWGDSRFNQLNQPVVGVSWNDATAYARWAGKRLPTEAEWEKAARGGLEGRKYPWGDTIDSSEARYGQYWSTGKPISVGSYSANGYGLYDMAGNVWEWCADWYDGNYYTSSPRKNPQGPSSGSTRVLRGGSWFNNFTSDLRVAPLLQLFLGYQPLWFSLCVRCTVGPFTLFRAMHGLYRFTTCWYRLAIIASKVLWIG